VEDEEDEDEEDQIEGGGLRNSMITTTSGSEAWPTIGRKRQVIGLLVLQLGIMIHSLVIGLTLAITTGADFSEYMRNPSQVDLFKLSHFSVVDDCCDFPSTL
jgi:zinc transporter 1/2/3